MMTYNINLFCRLFDQQNDGDLVKTFSVTTANCGKFLSRNYAISITMTLKEPTTQQETTIYNALYHKSDLNTNIISIHLQHFVSG